MNIIIGTVVGALAGVDFNLCHDFKPKTAHSVGYGIVAAIIVSALATNWI